MAIIMPDMDDDFKEKMREPQIFWLIKAILLILFINVSPTIMAQSPLLTELSATGMESCSAYTEWEQTNTNRDFILVPDEALLSKIESQNCHPVLDYALETVSLVSPFIEGGITAERLLTGYVEQNESAKNAGVIAATALIGTQIINVVLKYAIGRRRPQRTYRPRLWNTRLTPSFPSGHTASSCAFATAMSAKYSRYKIPLFAYACLSGYTQMYVGNHYPSDVVAGAILGYGCGELASRYDTLIVCRLSF